MSISVSEISSEAKSLKASPKTKSKMVKNKFNSDLTQNVKDVCFWQNFTYPYIEDAWP